MTGRRVRGCLALAAANLAAIVAMPTAALGQSDRPPIFDFVPGAGPSPQPDTVPLSDRKPDYLVALNRRIYDLYHSRKYAEAISLAERALELTRSQKGPDHLDTAT